MTDLFVHIAIGKQYAGREVQQGVAVYVTSEGLQGVKRRLVAMRRYHQIEGKKVVHPRHGYAEPWDRRR